MALTGEATGRESARAAVDVLIQDDEAAHDPFLAFLADHQNSRSEDLSPAHRPISASTWESSLNSSGNPNIPTPDEAMKRALTHDERDRLVAHLEPKVE
jgi:hypothetical protein